MATVLVTGGAGFIGSRVAELGLMSGHAIHILDNLSTGRADVLANLERKGAVVVLGDLRDADARSRALHGVDAVVHLAAQVSVPASITNPNETFDINVIATEGLLKDMEKFDIKRLILASSAAVYGDALHMPLHEDALGKCLSPYAESKLANEESVRSRHDAGWQALALRFFNVYGSGQRSAGAYSAVIPAFVERLCNGEAPTIFGTGGQTRDFVHVDDVAKLMLRLATDQWNGTKRPVYNVGSGQGVSLVELLRTLKELFQGLGHEGGDVHPNHDLARPGDITHSVADTQAIAQDLEWHATIALEQGLLGMITSRLAQGP